jgi:HEAT repeat protein
MVENPSFGLDNPACLATQSLMKMDRRISLVSFLAAVTVVCPVLSQPASKDSTNAPPAETVSKIGLPAINTLIAALQHSDSLVRGSAKEALVKIGSPAVEPLVEALKDATNGSLISATLIEIGTPSVQPLILALRNSKEMPRDLTLASLVDRQRVRYGLEPSAAGHEIGSSAADALAAIGASAVPPLVAALGDDHMYAPYWARHALAKIGAPSVPALIAVLKDGRAGVRYGAVEALKQIGDSRAVEPLIAALSDKETQRSAAAALGWIGDPRAVPPLLGVLESSQRELRIQAAWALGRIGDVRAVEPLINRLKADFDVRDAAAWALGKIGDARAVEPLIAALKLRNSCISAASALGSIRDARAIQPLIAVLEDQSSALECDGCRASAIVALQAIGQPAIDGLLTRQASEPVPSDWIGIALAAHGQSNLAAVVLNKLCDDTYPTAIKGHLLRVFDFSHSTNLLNLLAQAETTAKDPGIRIAARIIRLGPREGDQVIKAATADPALFPPTVTALSYLRPNYFRYDYRDPEKVENLGRHYIRRGDEQTIPQLILLLDVCDSKSLAEDYLNCGQPELGNAASAWARAKGWNIQTLYGSPRARFGSDAAK